MNSRWGPWVALWVVAAVLLSFYTRPYLEVRTSRTSARLPLLPPGDDGWQFAVFGDRTGGSDAGLKILDQAVWETNLLDPDLTMTVGDLIDGYNTLQPWLRQMQDYQGIMNKLSRPWYPVAGNHDVYWRGPDCPVGHHEANYEEHFGPLWYWFPHKNAAFVVLYSDEGDRSDNSKGFSRERHIQMSEEQLSWLGGTLEEAAEYQHVFVFLHHPRWLKYYRKNNWDQVHQLLAEAGNVSAVFAGHLHQMRYDGVRDGIEYFALAATGAHTRMDFPEAGYLHHYNIVTVREDELSMVTLEVGTAIDPRQVTTALADEINALLGQGPPAVLAPLQIEAQEGASGEYRLQLSNPGDTEVEYALQIDTAESRWDLKLDPSKVKLKGGEHREMVVPYRQRFDLAYEDFSLPSLRVQIDYLAAAGRISLPERSWPLKARCQGLPPGAGDAPVNGVLLLSGRGDCLQIDAADLGLEGEFFTLEAWVKPDQLTGSSSLVGKTESSEFGLFLEGGKPQLMVHLQGDYVRAISADVEVHPGRWQHVAGTYDGKHLRVFVDGRKVAEAAASGARKRNSLPLFVGAEPQGDRSPTGFLQGAVDEVRISKVVRYRGKFTPQRRLQSDSRTLALFRLDRNLGPFVLDHSARAQHAQRLGRAICVFADSE